MKPSRYLTLALLALIISLSLHKIYDPDFWMHVAAGDCMRTTHAILRANTFSFSYPQWEWLDVYWLYEIVLSWLWQWGHATAVILFRIALVLALAALVLLGFRDQRQPLSAGATAVLLFAWLLLAPRLTDRPELLSFVIFAAMLTLVRQERWWWCLPLQVIWANVHGFFCWGPAILAVAALSEWAAGNRRTAHTATFVAIAAVAASALSPFGWRNWLVPVRGAATMQAFAGRIEELASPFHPVVRATDGSGWLLIVFVTLAAVLLAPQRKIVRLFDWLAMAVSLPLAMTVRRSIPLFVLCVLPALLAVTPRIDKSAARAAVVCLCVMLAIGWQIRGREFGVGIAEDKFPQRAVEFVRQHVHQPLRLFNVGFSTGGYLTAYHLPVLIDGRLEAYPQEFTQEYLRAMEDDAVFRKIAHEQAVTHALLVTSTAKMRAFARRVASLPEWETLYTDNTAVVLERKP